MKFFRNIIDLDTARARYHELVQSLHPDHGGNADRLREMTKEYEDIQVLIRYGKLQDAPKQPPPSRKPQASHTTQSAQPQAPPIAIQATVAPTFQQQLQQVGRQAVIRGVEWMVEELFGPSDDPARRQSSGRSTRRRPKQTGPQ